MTSKGLANGGYPTYKKEVKFSAQGGLPSDEYTTPSVRFLWFYERSDGAVTTVDENNNIIVDNNSLKMDLKWMTYFKDK